MKPRFRYWSCTTKKTKNFTWENCKSRHWQYFCNRSICFHFSSLSATWYWRIPWIMQNQRLSLLYDFEPNFLSQKLWYWRKKKWSISWFESDLCFVLQQQTMNDDLIGFISWQQVLTLISKLIKHFMCQMAPNQTLLITDKITPNGALSAPPEHRYEHFTPTGVPP